MRGRATRITDKTAKLRALRIITDRVVEASAKVRAGDPIDEPEDMAGPWWAGVIPVETRFGAPRAAADLTGTNPVPAAYTALEGTVR